MLSFRSSSETAFVLPATDDDHDIHVRFFNARKEAAFVGHATLAVHHVLLELGLRNFGIHRQKSRLGIIAVTAESGGESLGAELGIEGFFPFALEQEAGQVRTRSRMFCPALGIPEDPVSGNAHAMLATYLWRHSALRHSMSEFTGLQGEDMGRPGSVNVRLELKDGELAAAHIGGRAITVSEGRLTRSQRQREGKR